MIKTKKEYELMKEQLKAEEERLCQQRQILLDAALDEEQLAAAMAPLESFMVQLQEEVEFYERVMRGDFSALESFESIGRLLIALRIYRKLSQHDLAVGLQVSDSQVSRDERDEYFGASREKISSVLTALGYRLKNQLEPIEEGTAAA